MGCLMRMPQKSTGYAISFCSAKCTNKFKQSSRVIIFIYINNIQHQKIFHIFLMISSFTLMIFQSIGTNLWFHHCPPCSTICRWNPLLGPDSLGSIFFHHRTPDPGEVTLVVLPRFVQFIGLLGGGNPQGEGVP